MKQILLWVRWENKHNFTTASVSESKIFIRSQYLNITFVFITFRLRKKENQEFQEFKETKRERDLVLDNRQMYSS